MIEIGLIAIAGSNSLISAQNIKRNVSLAEQEASGLVARSPEQAAKITSELLNSSASDVITKEVYVSQPTAHEEVWYLAMTIDREAYRPAIIVSKNGGTDIRTIASQHPGSIFSYHLTLSEGITPALIRRIAADQGITSDSEIASLTTTLNALHKVFREKEGMLLEVRSLARANGTFTCLDSSFLFDDDAHKRQPELFALRDKAQEVGDEVEAEKYGLVYVRMDGNIGNVVNGAGLAMATNDAIGLAGGKSANFLDAGGQATTETMMKAFGIILRDERVKAILVNIYGGEFIGRAVVAEISNWCRHHEGRHDCRVHYWRGERNGYTCTDGGAHSGHQLGSRLEAGKHHTHNRAHATMLTNVARRRKLGIARRVGFWQGSRKGRRVGQRIDLGI